MKIKNANDKTSICLWAPCNAENKKRKNDNSKWSLTVQQEQEAKTGDCATI